jgi:hypothetical protein
MIESPVLIDLLNEHERNVLHRLTLQTLRRLERPLTRLRTGSDPF